MKVTPMLFNDEMARAIVDGRKTQTRRIVKPAKCRNTPLCDLSPCEIAGEINRGDYSNSPYGKPGDLIYVRETFLGPLVDPDGDYPDGWHHVKHCIYRADGHPMPEYVDMDDNLRFGWKPSIHMPRWASRLTLKIKSIRIERLQDISEKDAKAEGVRGSMISEAVSKADSPLPESPYIGGFMFLWQSINGLDSWDANSWVWRIEYEPIMQNVDVYLSELEEAA